MQNKIAKDLQDHLGLTDDDVRPAIMGETGVDLKLMSEEARRKVGLAIECKSQEKLNIWSALDQASENASALEPAVVFTRNRSLTYVAIKWDHLLTILKKLNCITDVSDVQK